MLASDDNKSELIDFFHTGKRIHYKKNDFVILPGQAPPGVMYVESGLVKAYDITKYGEENLLIIRKAGEVLALTWAITEENRHIIYQALDSTTVWRVTKKEFVEFVRKHPSIALPLIDLITDMYRRHSQRILNLEYRSVRERLISFLLNMSDRFGKETPKGLLIDVPLKHQDVASSINASRETTSRAITKLQEHGLLTNHQTRFILHNIEKLRRYL